MRLTFSIAVLALLLACSAGNTRGIADRRTDFKQFLPMKGEPSHYGLRTVRPFFRSANRAEIMRAIDNACRDTRKRGSAVTDERRQAGYYVNCNPENRQLLNGYIPANQRERPHS